MSNGTWNYVCSRNSQWGVIIRKMAKSPLTWFVALDFMNFVNDRLEGFVGYKAGTRLSELQKNGVLIGRWSTRETQGKRPYMEYRLNHERYEFMIDTERAEIYKRPHGPYTESEILRRYSKKHYALSTN